MGRKLSHNFFRGNTRVYDIAFLNFLRMLRLNSKEEIMGDSRDGWEGINESSSIAKRIRVFIMNCDTSANLKRLPVKHQKM
jgi:hypothetical protein